RGERDRVLDRSTVVFLLAGGARGRWGVFQCAGSNQSLHPLENRGAGILSIAVSLAQGWINADADFPGGSSHLMKSLRHLTALAVLLGCGSATAQTTIFDQNFDGGYTGAFGLSSYSGGSPTGA